MPDFINILISLAIPLYQTSLVFKTLFTAIALQFNGLADAGTTLAKQAFPQCTNWIAAIANDRGIVRIAGESDPAYKNRVTYAYEFQRNSSTFAGITSLIQRITDKPFVIRELYKETWILGDPKELLGITTILGSPLDRFFFIVEFQTILTNHEKIYITNILDIYKPAHTDFRIIDIIETQRGNNQ